MNDLQELKIALDLYNRDPSPENLWNYAQKAKPDVVSELLRALRAERSRADSVSDQVKLDYTRIAELWKEVMVLAGTVEKAKQRIVRSDNSCECCEDTLAILDKRL